jgi:hypothetical protein
MQAAKDSFYMALCARLQQVNPQRTVMVEGEVRPALLVAENEPAICSQPAEAFCIEWEKVQPVSTSPLVTSTLMSAEVQIRYRTCGGASGECDRGRSLSKMDAELMAICTPPRTPKLDYTQATPVALGSNVFWKGPSMEAAVQTASMLARTATAVVYFYPEAEA